MKFLKKLVLSLFLAMIYTNFALISFADWEQVGNDLRVDPSKSALFPDIDFQDDGNPVVTWDEQSDGLDKIFVKRFNGTSWDILGNSLNVTTDAHSNFPNIAIDKNLPFVIWQEWEGHVKKHSASNWEILSTPSLVLTPGNWAYQPKIAFSNNILYAAWGEKTPKINLYVKLFNSSWSQIGGSLNINTATNVKDISIAVHNNIPYVAFNEFDGNNKLQLYVKYFNGTNWDLVGVSSLNNDTNESIRYPEIKILNGTPYVTWTENNQIYVKKWATTLWLSVGNSPGNGTLPKLAFKNNTPYITWLEGSVKYYNGLDWEQLGSGISGHRKDIGINNNGEVYVTSVESAGPLIVNKFVPSTSTPTVTPTFTPTPTPTPSVKVYSINPKQSLPDTTINVTILGEHFEEPISVKLTHPSSSDRLASNVVIHSTTKLTCQFNLAGLQPGNYSIAVGKNMVFRSLDYEFTIMNPLTQPYGWLATDLPITSESSHIETIREILIGDVNNEGTNKVYIAGLLNQVLAFENNAGNWTTDGLTGVSGDNYFSKSMICDGNLDGFKEIYGGTIGSAGHRVYQFSGTDLQMADISGDLGSDITAMAYGDADDDNKIELYVGCDNGTLYQLKYADSWSNSVVGNTGARINDLTLDDGDNNGTIELFAACDDDHVYKLELKIGSWEKVSLGSSTGAMDVIAVGDVDHDDQNEVYGIDDAGKLIQFKWSNLLWLKNEVMDIDIVDLVYGDGNTDGIKELYGATSGGSVVKINYDNDSWSTALIGQTQGPLMNLALGDGDNDYQYEIYTINDKNQVVQFNPQQLIPTLTPTPEGFEGRIISKKYTYTAPNPVRGHQMKFVVHVKEAAKVKVKMYTTSNKFVLSFELDCSVPGKYEHSIYVGNLANGVYLLLVKARSNSGGEERLVKKIGLIK